MNKKGITLIEVLIASAILSVALVAYMLFSNFVLKSTKRTIESSSMLKALSAIEKNILNDTPFLPPQDGLEDSGGVAGFEDSSGTVRAFVSERCYDTTGTVLANCTSFASDVGKAFRVEFFKERVRDRSLDAQSPLNHIPLSRVRFRVFYKRERSVVADARYFARLETGILRY